MGPQARDLLQSLSEADFSDAAFPWLSGQLIRVTGIETIALRLSYAGELGWELHVPLGEIGRLYDAIIEAGRRFDLRPFGVYALNSMRLEKGYRAWGLDLTTERTPLEAGLDALVKTNGRSFIGRDSMLERAGASAWRMALLEIEPDPDRLPFYNHALIQAGRPVGIVTSAAQGFRTEKTLALAYVTPRVGGRSARRDRSRQGASRTGARRSAV